MLIKSNRLYKTSLLATQKNEVGIKSLILTLLQYYTTLVHTDLNSDPCNVASNSFAILILIIL
jgi:hypothetical protein